MRQLHRSKILAACSLAATLVLSACGGGSSLTEQTLTFATIADKAYSATASTLTATASSSLAVTFSSLTTSVCTVSGTSLTLVAPGSCQIKASQAGNSTYAAAADKTNTFTVTQAPQTITFASPGNQTIGTAPPALSATGGDSGVAVSIASSTPSVCTVAGTALTLVSAGTCTLTASQAGNTNYSAAANVSNTITVATAVASGKTGTCTASPCLDFASASLALEGFEGLASATVVNDPVDASNKVAKLVKAASGQPWAGATVYADGTAKTITSIDASKGVTLRVYSPAIGEKIMVKLEGATGAADQEAQATTTKAGEWETLSFTYAIAGSYTKVSIFPGFMTQVDKTYYVDELKYTAGSGTTPTPVAFSTVTFDETTAPGLTEFGTNGSGPLIANDPAGGTNKVAKIFKYTASEQWAGTTVVTISATSAVGVIPFTSTAKTMSVRVWSPAVGVRVRLKVENSSSTSISCETDALTTKADAWETLTFNFANPGYSPPLDTTKPTSSLDLTKTYDKASIFFDFGLGNGGYGYMPAARTYYFDDLRFGTP